MVKCKLCGCDKFTSVFDVCYCDRCGLAYSIDGMEIVDVDKVKIKQFAMEVINKIKDEATKNYYFGVFEGYYASLFDSRKKVREWGLMKLVELLEYLNGTDMVRQ